MAELIRTDHRLLTIRIRLQVGRSTSMVVLTGFRGRERLMEAETPPDAFGIRPELRVDAYRNARFELPNGLGDEIVRFVESERGAGEPLWLQIDRSSGVLAVVSWERLLSPLVNAPILRIPNFIAEPPPPTGDLTFALCASSPRAKTPYPVDVQVRRIIAQISEAVPGAPIHVFADQDEWVTIRENVPGDARVVVHDPAEAESYAPGRTGRLTGGAQIESPWLVWMRSALAQERLAAVHFICPGYFSGGRGALALATSPLANTDAAWSHFVGAQELESFLRLTGTWALALSAPYDSVWTVGLRLLTEEMCWARPGPLILDEPFDPATDDLGGVYAFLLGESAWPPVSGGTSIRCHPRRLHAYAEVQAGLESPHDPTSPPVDEATKEVQSMITSLIAPSLESTQARPWHISALQGLEQEISDLPGCMPDELRGRADALRFLTDVIGESGNRGVSGGRGIGDYIEGGGSGGAL